MIAILDNGSYAANEVITVPVGSRLLVVAAGWPDPGPDTPGGFTPSNRRPHLTSSLTVQGGGFLGLNGLLIEGGVSVRAGGLQRLAVAHCTIAPTRGGLIVKQANEGLVVEFAATICGPVELHRMVTGLRIRDSIVASLSADPAAVADAHAPVWRMDAFRDRFLTAFGSNG